MTRNKVALGTGARNGISQQDALHSSVSPPRPLGLNYAKPRRDQVDRLAQVAGLIHDSGQMYLDQQRAEFARQSQALAEALDEFKTDLDFAHILPSEEWTDARARAWRGFLLRLENSGLPDFVVSSAALMDQEVRP